LFRQNIKYSSNEILVFGRPIINSVYKLFSLKMTKWHAHVAHMAKHMNMVGAFFGGSLVPPRPRNPALHNRGLM